MCPSFLELRIRRLKMVQRAVQQPLKHVQYFAAILGQCRFETGPTLDHDGVVCDSANPWAKQLRDDLLSLQGLDSAESVLDQAMVRDGELSLRTSLTPPVSEDLAQLDLSELRARFLAVTMAPPGVGAVHGQVDHHVDQCAQCDGGGGSDDQTNQYICECVCVRMVRYVVYGLIPSGPY